MPSLYRPSTDGLITSERDHSFYIQHLRDHGFYTINLVELDSLQVVPVPRKKIMPLEKDVTRVRRKPEESGESGTC